MKEDAREYLEQLGNDTSTDWKGGKKKEKKKKKRRLVRVSPGPLRMIGVTHWSFLLLWGWNEIQAQELHRELNHQPVQHCHLAWPSSRPHLQFLQGGSRRLWHLRYEWRVVVGTGLIERKNERKKDWSQKTFQRIRIEKQKLLSLTLFMKGVYLPPSSFVRI